MSAIAGVASLDTRFNPAEITRRLLNVQAVYGPHASGTVALDNYSCGRNLFRSLPNDRLDRQPLTAGSGRFCMVADVRLDEPEELASALAIERTALDQMSDADLLFQAVLKWGKDAPNRVDGDFAFAFFDATARELFLSRSPTGEKPLHYLQSRNVCAFASLPHALAAAFHPAGVIDGVQLSRFVADMPNTGSRSYFQHVSRVEPGHLVFVTPSGTKRARYWFPPTTIIQIRGHDLGDALREHLDAAVRRRIRRSGGLVAAHLSAGADSSAVATSVALQLREPLLAFTSAPAEDTAEDLPSGRFGDESLLASLTARLHENITHHVIRPEHRGPLEVLESSHALAGQPVGNVFNNVWWQAIQESAATRGATVLLTGEAGNFGLSAGRRLTQLPEFLRAEGLRSWWKQVMAAWSAGYSIRNLAVASFAIHVPLRLFQRLTGNDGFWSPEFLREPWRELLGRRREPWDARPAGRPRQRWWDHLQMVDPGNFRKMTLARWGVEERDPTADRRLLEFCFTLPPSAFLDNGVDRVALRRALSGRVAPDVLSTRMRGAQSADWNARVSPATLKQFLSELPENPVVDQRRVLSALDQWPSAAVPSLTETRRFAISLMRAISASQFAATSF